MSMFNNPLSYDYSRILNVFRGTFYCLNLATVAVDISVESLTLCGLREGEEGGGFRGPPA